MAISTVTGVRIAGLAAVVPKEVVNNDALAIFDEEERAKIIQTTGIRRRRRAPTEVCTSDLVYEAALDILSATGVSVDDISLVILVTQTPDQKLPATAITLAARLGAPKSCAAFDVNLGCSGYTYGLWQAAVLLKSLDHGKALLLVGDVTSRLVSDQDRAAVALFGDCGTATLLEVSESASPMYFDLGSDGTGAEHLIVPAGGERLPYTPEHTIRAVGKDGNFRAATELFMDGPQVFNFTLREVPRSVKAAMEAANWAVSDVDAFVFHQANRFILDYVAKRSGVPAEAMKFSIEDFGNTSSATIPLTLATACADDVAKGEVRVLASGFGVGWSWASCAMTIGAIPKPTLREV